MFTFTGFVKRQPISIKVFLHVFRNMFCFLPIKSLAILSLFSKEVILPLLLRMKSGFHSI